jgi:hypothetical protein
MIRYGTLQVGELPRNFGVDFELVLGRDVAVLGGPEGFLGSGASGMVYKGTYKVSEWILIQNKKKCK